MVLFNSKSFSIFDIASDIYLFTTFLEATDIKTVPMENDTSVLNNYDRSCTFVEENDDGYKFSCEEHNPMFAGLTLLFIYLPSLNVLATLYGPKTAGFLGFMWGAVMFAVFMTLLLWLDGGERVILWFFMLLGLTMVAVGGTTMSKDQEGKKMSFKEHTISGPFFPIFLLISPLIFILIKFLALVKPNSQLLKAQSMLGSRGESILEAAPQFGLQCYIIFLTLTPPGWIKLVSISTSALTLSLKNIEHYVTACLEEKKEKSRYEEFRGTLKLKMHYSKSP